MTSGSSLRLMEALLEAGVEGAHREALIRGAKISTATFYRALEPLQKAGLVVDQGGRYVLPLSHPHNYAFKLWRDQAQLLELPSATRDELQTLIGRIEDQLGTNLLALWFYGSVARNEGNATSDLDFLAVVRQEHEVELVATRETQLVSMTATEFDSAFRNGDGFVRTVLRFGLLVVDRNFGRRFFSEPWPALNAGGIRDQEEQQARLRSRLLFLVREEEWVEARKALASLTVAVVRSVLDVLGQLPAGKLGLVEAVRRFFGPEWALRVASFLSSEGQREELLGAQSELFGWQQSFLIWAPHVRKVVEDLSGSGYQVQAACKVMLDAVAPTAEAVKEVADSGIDHQVCLGEKTVLPVVIKSTTSDAMALESVARWSDRPLLLVANCFSGVPVAERPPLLESARQEARRHGVLLVSTTELLADFLSQLTTGSSDFGARLRASLTA